MDKPIKLDAKITCTFEDKKSGTKRTTTCTVRDMLIYLTLEKGYIKYLSSSNLCIVTDKEIVYFDLFDKENDCD